jgi:hypothetical protein
MSFGFKGLENCSCVVRLSFRYIFIFPTSLLQTQTDIIRNYSHGKLSCLQNGLPWFSTRLGPRFLSSLSNLNWLFSVNKRIRAWNWPSVSNVGNQNVCISTSTSLIRLHEFTLSRGVNLASYLGLTDRNVIPIETLVVLRVRTMKGFNICKLKHTTPQICTF